MILIPAEARCRYAALQSQKAVTAYLKSKQLLPFGVVRQAQIFDQIYKVTEYLWLIDPHYFSACSDLRTRYNYTEIIWASNFPCAFPSRNTYSSTITLNYHSIRE